MGFGFRVSGFGFRLRVWGLGFGSWDLGFRVWGLGFRVWSAPFSPFEENIVLLRQIAELAHHAGIGAVAVPDKAGSYVRLEEIFHLK